MAGILHARYLESLTDAKEFIVSKLKLPATTALVLDSGQDKIIDDFEIIAAFDYS